VAVNSPGSENAFCETIFARPPDVIHDLMTAVFHDRFANARGENVENFVPRCLFPFPFTAFTRAFQWIENAIGIGDLVERCRALGAVSPARARVFRIAFELLYFTGDFIDVSQQPTRGFAIETGCGNK
jgi:hypothetical protein